MLYVCSLIETVHQVYFMVNPDSFPTTYLFGVFSDTCDAVALDRLVSQYSDQTAAFSGLSTIIVSSILEKIALSLSSSDLDKFVSLCHQRVVKNDIRQWLDTKLPDATLLLTETAELSLFGLSELNL